MGVQNTANINTVPFIRGLTSSLFEDSAVVLQNGSRTTLLKAGTVMAKNPTTSKWVPYTNIAATDGTEYPRGIILTDILAASLVAGDVSDIPILIKGDVDTSQVTLENSVTLTSIIASNDTQVVDFLREVGIYLDATVDTEEFQPLN